MMGYVTILQLIQRQRVATQVLLLQTIPARANPAGLVGTVRKISMNAAKILVSHVCMLAM